MPANTAVAARQKPITTRHAPVESHADAAKAALVSCNGPMADLAAVIKVLKYALVLDHAWMREESPIVWLVVNTFPPWSALAANLLAQKLRFLSGARLDGELPV